MLDVTLEAFKTSKSEKLQGMDEKDNEVDELRWSIFRDCLKHMFDDRKNSNSFGVYAEYILTPKDYFLITIPPFIWNGFIGLDKNESIVANCINLPHDENEMVRRKHDDKYFKYDWGV